MIVDELAHEERRKYAKMWSVPEYRRHSPGLAIAKRAASLLRAGPGASITDWGCGEGHALRELESLGLEARGVDIVALRPAVVEACLWELPEDLSETDYALCADVMEHIPPERVDDVLAGIRARTRIGGVFTIADTHCTVGRRHGEELHLTIQGPEWWREKLLEHWADVQIHQTDKRWRHVFVVNRSIIPSRPYLVVGGGASVWDDLAAVRELVGGEWPGFTILVNDIGCHWPARFDHWVTLHPERFGEWESLRAANGHPSGYLRWARRERRLVDGIVQPWAGGSSGLLGVALAYKLGTESDAVVLAGIPLDSRPHFAESSEHDVGAGWDSADTHWRGWQRNMERLKERTRSMSGRTRHHLGVPTSSWLEGMS